MDFTACPVVIQHQILRSMDIRSFFKTAVTSKTVFEVAAGCLDKYWDADITRNELQSYTIFIHTPKWTCHTINSVKTFRLLFHHATIKALRVCTIPDDIDLRCQSLYQGDRVATLSMLKRHKPTGKYSEIVFTRLPHYERPELLEWLNDSVNSISYVLKEKSERLPLRVPNIWARVSLPVAEYAQMLVEEWLRGEREIWSIDLGPNKIDIAPEIHLEFFEKHPKLELPEYAMTLYRIRRQDGDMLAVARQGFSSQRFMITAPEQMRIPSVDVEVVIVKFLQRG